MIVVEILILLQNSKHARSANIFFPQRYETKVLN